MDDIWWYWMNFHEFPSVFQKFCWIWPCFVRMWSFLLWDQPDMDTAIACHARGFGSLGLWFDFRCDIFSLRVVQNDDTFFETQNNPPNIMTYFVIQILCIYTVYIYIQHLYLYMFFYMVVVMLAHAVLGPHCHTYAICNIYVDLVVSYSKYHPITKPHPTPIFTCQMTRVVWPFANTLGSLRGASTAMPVCAAIFVPRESWNDARANRRPWRLNTTVFVWNFFVIHHGWSFYCMHFFVYNYVISCILLWLQ